MNSSALVQGFGLGLGLIVAIGAQNAFVLKQGLQKRHVFLVAAICAFSDIVLIAAGLGGMGVLVEKFPMMLQIAGLAGTAFLVYYGIRSAYSAFQKKSMVVNHSNADNDWDHSALKALAFTWLNPHVYLDTVVLIGGIGLQFQLADRWWFGLGAGLASVFWFFGLAYGATLVSPYFAKESTWRGLNLLIAGIMFWTAYWMSTVLL